MPNRFQRLDQYEHIEILGDGKIEWKRASAPDKHLLEMRVAGDLQQRFAIEAGGILRWGPGNAGLDCLFGRSATNLLSTYDQINISAGVGNFCKAGVPVDGDFFSPVDGLLAVDTSANKLYIRSSGAWVLVGP